MLYICQDLSFPLRSGLFFIIRWPVHSLDCQHLMIPESLNAIDTGTHSAGDPLEGFVAAVAVYLNDILLLQAGNEVLQSLVMVDFDAQFDGDLVIRGVVIRKIQDKCEGFGQRANALSMIECTCKP